MIETFEKLDSDKQKRILNAALEEFASKGYKQTATDDIVTRAGISKGALFHYFGSKERLYKYLVQFVLATYSQQIYSEINFNEPDFFNRLRQALKAKLEVSITYPALGTFWERAKQEARDTTISHFQKNLMDANLLSQDFLKNVDFSKFKEELDLRRTLNVIFWTLDQFSKEVVKQSVFTQEPLDWVKEYAEAEEYLDYFQKLFYKESS